MGCLMKKVITLSFLTLTSLMLYGCNADDDDTALEIQGNYEVSSEASSSLSATPKNEGIATRHESVKTNADGSTYISIIEETDDYIINIELPNSSSNEVKTSLHKKLEGVEETFKRAVIKDQERTSALEVSFETDVLNDTVTVYKQRAEVKNTNADRTYLQTFIEYDGALLSFEDMFDDSKEARELYHHYVMQALYEDRDNAPHLNKSALARSIVKTDSAIDKVYPSKNGLVFQFDTLEVGGIEAGTPSVTVDYQYISQLMTNECVEMIGNVTEEWVLQGEYAGSAVPSVYDTFYILRDVDTDKKLVALTFDDGPVPGSTELILDVLEEHDVKATFFVLGQMVEEYPDIAKRIVDEGHEIANHTYSHPEMTKLSDEGLRYEIGHTQSLIQEHTGTWPRAFRPPYGASNQYVRDTVGIREVMWNIDTMDWQTRNSDLITNSVMTSVQDGSLILMHDIVDATPQAVVNLMDNLDHDEFEFVTVSELYEYREDVYTFNQ